MAKPILLPKEIASRLVDSGFLLLLGFYLLVGTLRTTSLEYTLPPFFTAAIAAGLICVIATKYFVLHLYSLKEAILYLVILTIVMVVILRNHHDTLMMLFFLVVASKGIDFRKIVELQLTVVTEVLLFSIVLSQTGISADYGINQFGHQFVTFGVSNTTDFSSYILFILLGYTFLRGNKITFLELILFVAGFSWIYEQTRARTAFYALLLFCLFVAFYKITGRISIRFPKMNYVLLGAAVMPMLSLIMLVLSFLYSDQSALMTKIDHVFTARIRLGHIGLNQYGIGLFGNEVIERGNGFGERPVSYFFLDSSYMRLFLVDGLLVFFLVMLIYACIFKKLLAGKNFIGIIVFVIIAITCLTEQHLLEPWYNPLTFLCLTELPSQKAKKTHVTVKLNDFLHQNKFILLFAACELATLLLLINFHTDGSSVTPGDYAVYVSSSSDVLGYDANSLDRIIVVVEYTETEVPPESFTLVFIANKTYYIEDGAGNRLTPHDDKLIMASPSAEDDAGQQWQILRSKRSPYFTITNVEKGLSLYVEESGALQYGDYIDDGEQFLFRFKPASR